MSSDTIYIRRDGVVATLHMNSVLKRNALTLDMWNRLTAAIEEADRDTAIKVIVVTGEGEHFSIGADIEELSLAHADPKYAEVAADAIQDAVSRLAHNRKPTIAKLRGVASGGGCSIALACDLRIADPTFRIAIAPARLGLVYPLADTKRLVELIGPTRAKDMLFTGRTLSVGEAQTFGLIDRVAPAAELDEAVYAFATQIADLSQFSIRAGKRLVRMALDGADDNDREARRLFVDSFSGADFKEGAAAFIHKRKPYFPIA
jgi:enoyl-CoA hydratase/carnithine racemase